MHIFVKCFKKYDTNLCEQLWVEKSVRFMNYCGAIVKISWRRVYGTSKANLKPYLSKSFIYLLWSFIFTFWLTSYWNNIASYSLGWVGKFCAMFYTIYFNFKKAYKWKTIITNYHQSHQKLLLNRLKSMIEEKYLIAMRQFVITINNTSQ